MRMNNVMSILAMSAQKAAQYINPFNLAKGENPLQLKYKGKRGWYNARVSEDRMKWKYIGNNEFQCRQTSCIKKKLRSPMTREQASLNGLL